MPSSLVVSISHASKAGSRLFNDDFVAMVTPIEPELSSKGVMAALADGVSGNKTGNQAAEYTVRGLLLDYYATPDTWEVSASLDKVLVAINSWLRKHGNTQPETGSMTTTLTALVLRGRMYYTAHVGDSRAYLLREHKLLRLTHDHVWDKPEMQHVLTRAVGLDNHLNVDHGMGELQAGDVFLLASDGLWNAFTDAELAGYITRRLADSHDGSLPEDCAENLCVQAFAGGAKDNISAVFLKVQSLPDGDLRDNLTRLSHLPVPPPVDIGQRIDDLVVEQVLHSSATTIVYRVFDAAHHRHLVLKTLQPHYSEDQQVRSHFAHEEWLAKRVVAKFFPQVITPLQRSYLYYLSTYHPGDSLQQKLDSGTYFTIPEIVIYGCKLVRAVGALHRRSVIHCSIKPDNVHLGDDDEIRLVDLSSARSGWHPAGGSNDTLTEAASYLAPELLAGSVANEQTDLYAVGVTLYYLLTRHYPYGEISYSTAPLQAVKFTEPVAPLRYRPDLPKWLETVLLKSVARDPADRFETADEFLLALERGPERPLPEIRSTPLIKRDPVLLWRSLAIVFFLLNVLLLYLLVIR